MLRRILIILGGLGVLGLVYGLLGAVHRSADSIAMLRPLFAIMAISGAVASRHTPTRLWMGMAGAVSLVSVLLFLKPQSTGENLRLYSKNLKFSNTEIVAVREDILRWDVDLVMLQEISDDNRALLNDLQARFPHQHLCQFDERYGVALLSRFPIAAPGKCSDARALAAVPVVIDGQEIWAVSVHLPWPWPDTTVENDTAADALIAALPGPFVIAGDFNIFPWSGRLQRMRRATETRLAGPLHITFSYRFLRAPIDHVLSPLGGSVQTRPLFGSDHFGVVADLRL